LKTIKKAGTQKASLKTKNLDSIPLPLLTLFHAIRREEGFSIGIGDYHDLIQSMQNGGGLASLDEQMRLCQLLWAKNEAQRLIVKDRYEQIVIALLSSQHNQDEENEEFEAAAAIAKDRKEVANTNQIVNANQKPIADVAKSENNQGPEGELNQNPYQKEDDSNREQMRRVPRMVKISRNNPEAEDIGLSANGFHNGGPVTAYFHLNDHFLDATEREMAQGWRRIRQLTRLGAKVEFDWDATVQLIAQQGFFSDVVIRPARVNRATLHVLVDSEGSMAPFHPISELLVQSLERGSKFHYLEVLYFHDLPGKNLYRTPRLNGPVDRAQWSRTLDLMFSHVLVISDAGAARGHLDDQRVAQSKNRYGHLRSRSRNLAILNPMPKDRWNETSAAPLAFHIPMFECNASGLRSLADYLRGASVQHAYSDADGKD
jgi:uncharacterized protein with von Willebrand factor type A (vWA) domain